MGRRYAAALLEALERPEREAAGVAAGARARRPDAEAPDEPHADLEWARSGAMALTGPADDPPLLAPVPLASCARGAALALERVVGQVAGRAPLDGAALLGERAALLGLTRAGRVSPGGSCQLLRAADRWMAVSLPRADDLACLRAWLGAFEPSAECPARADAADDPWRFVEERLARLTAAEAVERGRLLGLAVAVAAEPVETPPPWCRVVARGPRRRPSRRARPLVVDLSSLWAGPLCTQLLGEFGARVIKVESPARPDGARSGPAAFFDLMNGGKESVALDFGSARGRAALGRLLDVADIVLESSRPRALAQLGFDAAGRVASRPGLTWVSITGYGRRDPESGWVAFGDDAAVAAGLASATGGASSPPLFCGDAIADPLTGIHAALAAQAAWQDGGGVLLDLALRDVVAHAMAWPAQLRRARVRPCTDPSSAARWEVVLGGASQAVLPPRARPATTRARPLGADSEAVLRELCGPAPRSRARD